MNGRGLAYSIDRAAPIAECAIGYRQDQSLTRTLVWACASEFAKAPDKDRIAARELDDLRAPRIVEVAVAGREQRDLEPQRGRQRRGLAEHALPGRLGARSPWGATTAR